jgi:hypothetical protein
VNLVKAMFGSLCLADGFDTLNEDRAAVLLSRLAGLPDSVHIGSLHLEGIDQRGSHGG